MASTVDLVANSESNLSQVSKNKPFKELTWREKASYVKKVITVEPLMCAYVMASVLCAPALYQLEFEKACRVNLDYGDVVCDSIISDDHSNYTQENLQIIVLISNMHSWQYPLQSVMPLILVLFLGSYSDRHKLRKPFLLMPLIGELLAVTGCILCVVFMKQWPLEAQGIAQTVIPSFFGGQTMIVMAAFAYIADVSSLDMRTLRIGVVQIVMNIAYPAVQSFSAILFSKIGYIGILAIAAALYTFGILYTLFWIKEPKTPQSVNKKNLLRDIFDPRYAIDTLKILFQKTPGNDRKAILLVLVVLFIYSGVVVGETTLFFLYTQSIFQWTVIEFTNFSTINTLVHLIGTAIAVPLFAKVFKLSDHVILILTLLDKIGSNFIYGFAKTSTVLYIATVFSVIIGVTSVAIRSMATKIVSENDLGKAQSLFGIFEAIAPAIATPIYNKAIYVNTLESFPAAFFFVGIVLYAFCCVLVLLMYIRERRNSAKKENPNIDKKDIHMNEVHSTHL